MFVAHQFCEVSAALLLEESTVSSGTDYLRTPSNKWQVLLLHRNILQHSSAHDNNLIMFRGRCSTLAVLCKWEQQRGRWNGKGMRKNETFCQRSHFKQSNLT